MKYHPNDIEAKWQKYWAENQTFAAKNPHSDNSPPSEKLGEPYYVLDMFPYPSGAGLHVGHPLGYIASDIVARYKRHQGFNVLHPQGYDSFGLPAEQYAIQTGQHPEKTTKENIARYREQLDKIGFSFDWSREVRTSNPDYYKWTQWIFIQLYNSYYCLDDNKAKSIDDLIEFFNQKGNSNLNVACDTDIENFTAEDWQSFSNEEKQRLLLKYRLTYLAEAEVNWCPALGTVLANDEIVNGLSERGGHPVIRKKMTQWMMRISAYAERLLQGLDTIDWSESIKESQRNWIGKSVGASVWFSILPPAPSRGGGDEMEHSHAEKIVKNNATSMEGRGDKMEHSHAEKIDENNATSFEVEGDETAHSHNEENVGNTKGNPRYLTGNTLNARNLLHYAKGMRKEPTFSEALLWENLRNKKLNVRFRRQHLIGNYIVDFVCLEKRLIIEVDGEYHNTKEQTELDETRTLELEQKHNFKVIRFSNEEVNNYISTVLNKIEEELKSRDSFKSLTQEELDNATSPSLEEKKTLSSPSPSGRVGVGIFTTRPDTIFGATFMVLAPEHELVAQIKTAEQKAAVDAYIETTSKRSERERMADVKTISGVFTGAYAEHPFTKEPMPIWIGDYVLAGYGTGAVMAVPCGDERDFAFAKHFGLPIKSIFNVIGSPPSEGLGEDAYTEKSGFELINSDFLNGLDYKAATKKVIEELEDIEAGEAKINYRLRDAVFSRQRYWGEPIPIYYKNGIPYPIPEECLPLKLPEVEKYLPTEDGQPPLGNAKEWYWSPPTPEGGGGVVSKEAFDSSLNGVGGRLGGGLELNTMPGWAGSSWYWMRYMDAHNDKEFASKDALNYWQNVDLYIGGSEHATGHLLYSRFWNKFLYDRGFAPTEEPFKKLINQGMILGMSAFVYRSEDSKTIYSKSMINDKKVQPIHVDLSVINDVTNELDIEAFKSHPLYVDYKEAEFIYEDAGRDSSRAVRTFIVGREVEKMSKSKYNVVNPDDICNEYGADTLRLYEMFLGPLEQAKPWNTAGISGVFGFLKKLWKLYSPSDSPESPSNSPEGGGIGAFCVSDEEPTGDMWKSLHKTIKKVTEDIENFSFNTSVSQFMICVNELTQQKCHHRAILEPLAILISPYAPHIAEELWEKLGHSGSIARAPFPKFEDKYLVESEKEYPVSFNGKMRFTLKLPLDLTKEQIEEKVMADERTQAQLQGRTPNKVIIVPGKIINLVG